MAATVEKSTDLRGRDLPASAEELVRAHIAADTPVEARIEDDQVIYRSVDTIERVNSEFVGPMSAERQEEMFARLDALADRREHDADV